MSTAACGLTRLNCPTSQATAATLTAGVTSTPILSPAWCVTDWSPIFGMSLRTSDTLVPFVDYDLPGSSNLASTAASLQMVFDGNLNYAGTSYAPNDLDHGLESNRLDFITRAVNPPATPNNLHTLTLALTNGTTLTAPLRTTDFQWNSRHPGLALAIWSVALPRGWVIT